MAYNKHEFFNSISNKYDFGTKRFINEVISTLESKFLWQSRLSKLNNVSLIFKNTETLLDITVDQIKINVKTLDHINLSLVFTLSSNSEKTKFQISIKELK